MIHSQAHFMKGLENKYQSRETKCKKKKDGTLHFVFTKTYFLKEEKKQQSNKGRALVFTGKP